MSINTYSSQYVKQGLVFKCENNLQKAKEDLETVIRTNGKVSQAYCEAIGKVFGCERALTQAKKNAF